MATANEPILSRFERLDLLIGYLEELKGMNKSGYSTPSSVTTTTNCGNSSVNSSPRGVEKHCRQLGTVILETQVKGSLVERLLLLENRVLKLGLQMEEEIEVEKKRNEEEERERSRGKKNGLKKLVRGWVGGEPKTKS